MAAIARRKLAGVIAARLAAGEGSRQVLKEAAAYLLDHRATNQTELLAADVASVLARDNRHLLVHVSTARPLSDQLRRDILHFLRQSTPNQSIELDERIDSTLLGGVVLETPDERLDRSLRARLQALRQL